MVGRRGARKRDEMKGKEYGPDGEHGVRFSDKISNLKFHRNFTILESKLIVLSTGTSNHPPLARRLYRDPPPPRRFQPNASIRLHLPPQENFENKQPITHYSPRLSERTQRCPGKSFWSSSWYNFDFDI